VLRKSIDELNHGVTGTLRVCTECYTSYYWLPPVLKKFKQKYPNVSVDIKVEGTHHAIDLLLDGELEIAFTNAKKHENILEYKPLFEDEMVAVVSSDHLWAEKKFVEAEDFKSENLIIHSRPLKSVIVYENLLKPNEIEPDNLTVLPLTEASIQLVKANMGVIVLPSWTLMPYLDDSITTLRVTKKGLHRTHYAAYLKQSKPLFLEHFLNFMKDNIQYDKAISN
jgi:LysR family transcriptional regulator for metE and metH